MNKNKRDYYEVLGISKTADEKEIKSAYRKLAITLIEIKSQMLKKNLKKFLKHMKFYQTLTKEQNMINMDIMLLIKVDFLHQQLKIFLQIFLSHSMTHLVVLQILLKTFLVDFQAFQILEGEELQIQNHVAQICKCN